MLHAGKFLFVDRIGGPAGLVEAAALAVHGHGEGEILNERRGNGGFGYDPLFLCETGETFAEIGMEQKNRISHRKRGIEAVLRALDGEEQA